MSYLSPERILPPFVAAHIARRAHDEQRAAIRWRDAARRMLAEVRAAPLTVEPFDYDQADVLDMLERLAGGDVGRAYDLAEARLRAAEAGGVL